jgi:hypothetical protein
MTLVPSDCVFRVTAVGDAIVGLMLIWASPKVRRAL